MTVLVKGWESEVALRYSDDLNQHHLGVFRWLQRSAPTLSHHSPAGRAIQYLTVSSQEHNRAVALVRFTGSKPDGHGINARERSFELHDGMQVKFAILMTAARQQDVAGRRAQVPVVDAEMAEFIASRMVRMGLAAGTDVQYQARRGLFVGKGAKGFGIDAVQVNGSATVTNPELVRIAWELGIGKQRTFGLGMLRLSVQEAS